MRENNVHVAFGFHVNCYHSYRGDTPDALGFGGDIRIMRHILDVLDDRNAKGIPVRGTWDIENAYSLERILPAYAPDIIERIRARGDENILMGYNNGAMSAMTEDELQCAIAWAITNPYGSGLKDVFGSYAPLLRPQEVMFTPSQVRSYRKAGVEALCLYYSCISFDAFRTLIPQLDDKAMFNPLTYRWGDDTITVLPIFSPNDVMDAGSLRALCVDLHAKQISGEIDTDVLVFINTDADSFLWEPMAVPKPLQKLPCFGGIGGYIDEIASLPFVRFDTPGEYCKTHAPVQEITFGEDVADGNLSGYMSWSEKPFNRLIWTRLERARRMAALGKSDAASPSFETRVRLLSTTHFGLASPVMNISREKKAIELTEKMLREEQAALPAFEQLVLLDPEEKPLASVQLSLRRGFCKDITALRLDAEGLRSWCACPLCEHADGSVSSMLLVASFAAGTRERALSFSIGEPRPVPDGSVEIGDLRLTLDGEPVLYRGDMPIARMDGWIRYGEQRCRFGRGTVQLLPLGGEGTGMRYCGEIHLPGEQSPGSYTLDAFTCGAGGAVFLCTAIQYPYTTEDHEISSQASNLGRYSDVQWREVAPQEWTIETDDSVRVYKRSFDQKRTDYPLSDLWTAFPQNENVCSINHQLTGGTLCVSGRETGLLLAHMRQAAGSMAHCPLRLKTENGRRIVSLNPFGTYFGPQRHYPSRGNGSSMELYLAAAPQARSLAPAYNGAFERTIQAIYAVSGKPSDALLREAEAIADGVIAVGGTDVTAFAEDNVQLHDPTLNKIDPKDLKSVTFVEQMGGVTPLLGLVKRYFANLRKAERRRKRQEKQL